MIDDSACMKASEERNNFARLVWAGEWVAVAELLFGVETEYAISGLTPQGAVGREQILSGLMDLAIRKLVHVPDLYSTGGVFLQNGSRFYADCGLHPEICTPECTNPVDVVRYIEAGHSILGRLAAELESRGAARTEIMCFRCNVDYSGSQSTWGCHESYLHRIPQHELQPEIVPHLVSRLIYTGAGGFNPLSPGLEFSLSPRMAYFQRLLTESSTSERGIWHTKSESLSSGYGRLHVLCGESLCSETANFLKAGTTALIVALADAGFTPGIDVQLDDPLAALQSVAGDVTCKKPQRMADGRSLTAIGIQRHYLEQVETHLGDGVLPGWATEVCRRWRSVLDDLEGDHSSAEKTLDWGIKRALYANHAQSLGIGWNNLPLLNQAIEQMVSAPASRKSRGTAQPLKSAIEARKRMPIEVAMIAPRFRSKELHWADLGALMSSREKFFEIDTRFGQLGLKGIFHTLDQAGVLNHRIGGAVNIEQVVMEPPTGSRAQIRGEVIKRLAGAGKVQCDWQQVINFTSGQILDLSDPFAQKELWGDFRCEEAPDRRASCFRTDWFSADGDLRVPREESCYARRTEALRLYKARDYAAAEGLLRGLVREGYEVASNQCHLARVLILMDRAEEARQEVRLATDNLGNAYAYVLPRVLYFQWMFAMLDGTDSTAVARQMRAALLEPGAGMEWTIQPMLDHLRPRMGESNFKFLKALANALSYSGGTANLDGFPQWRSEPATNEVAS